MQANEAPPFDSELAGKWLEICWSYTNKDTNEKVLVWSTGRVARVADGLTDKRSARAKKLLPAGALLWQWEADPEFEEAAGEQWMILLPKKWKQTTLYGWRFDPRELSGAARTQERPERPRNVRRCDLGDE